MPRTLETPRLRLCAWAERHRAPFAAMHADPAVMEDYGGPISPGEADHKFARYVAAWQEQGIGRWAVERARTFLGYVGVMHHASHPLGPHAEIGWRLVYEAWGYGYAIESAQAAIAHAVNEVGLHDILAYTTAENLRSQAVIARLGMRREPLLDFIAPGGPTGLWHGLVWRHDPEASFAHRHGIPCQ